MPINPIILQRRHAEIGRIRLGEKGAKGQPVKLTTFRFTSPNRQLIEAVADLYGGTAKPWDNGGKPEFEVVTDASTVPVIVIKGGLSQWMETWSGGGCIHRCDGINDAITGAECNPKDRNHLAAKPYTRLSTMLRDVESLGAWRMESHGWNAAAEIPAMAELAMYVGDLVPAVLHLVERRAVKEGKTSRFVVPVLDLLVSKRRLVELVSGNATGMAAIAAAQGPAAIGGRPREVDIDTWIDLLADATTPDECRAIWDQAGQAGELTPDLQERIKARAAECAAEQVAAGPQSETESGVDSGFDPRPVSDTQADIDDLWFRVVAEAGRREIDEPALRDAFARAYGHDVAEAIAAELEAFLTELRSAA